jgi:hypothetical protein
MLVRGTEHAWSDDSSERRLLTRVDRARREDPSRSRVKMEAADLVELPCKDVVVVTHRDLSASSGSFCVQPVEKNSRSSARSEDAVAPPRLVLSVCWCASTEYRCLARDSR